MQSQRQPRPHYVQVRQEDNSDGAFEDGTYFTMREEECKLVDKMSEEICLSTRFLSLASNRLHSASKQELCNDMVKVEDNYPRTIASTLRFLQNHNLRGKKVDTKIAKKDRIEIAFAQKDGDEDSKEDDSPAQTRSKTCG